MIDELRLARDEPPAVDDGAVFRSLSPELVRFATGLVGAADADDVVANAFARARAAPTWPTVANRRAYLYRAVHNEAATLLRGSARRRRRETGAATTDRWELPDLDPEVRAAVLSLSLQQRAVVVLTYWLDLDPAAAADHLGISEGSVRRHLARARAHLRKALQ